MLVIIYMNVKERARWLERQGHWAAAVPGFIPIDMAPPKLEMRGAVDWREAAVKAGIGGYGEGNLVVTKEFGPAVRLGGLVMDAEIRNEPLSLESPCLRCNRCVEACPSGGLSGQGGIDKKKCGDAIFSGGFRAWRRFLLQVVEAEPEARRDLPGGRLSLDLWQNFMTGNYYSCFACQAACPLGGSGG
jgi:epoxyqueuosine reductase QueG